MHSNQYRALLLSALTVMAVFVGGLALTGAPAFAAEEEDSLTPGPINTTGVIDQPGVYTLQNDLDLGGTNVTAFEITSSDVVLDGGGHTISNGIAEAVHVLGKGSANALQNVTIRNLRITGVETAISAQNVRDSAFVNLDLVSNADAALTIAGSGTANNLVADVTARDNAKGVFMREGTSGATIRDSTFDSNHEVAIKASGSSDNEILDSHFTGQDGEKTIHLTGRSPDNVIRGNVLEDNDGPEYAIQVGGESPRTVIADNVVRDNDRGGISVGTADNDIVNNTVTGNAVPTTPSEGVGIALSGAGNTISENTVTGNNVGVAFDGASGSAGTYNTVKNNALWDVHAAGGATNNLLTETVVDDAGTAVTVTTDAVDFALKGAGEPLPAAPAGYAAIGKYVEVTTTSDTGLASVYLHYENSDVSGVTEADLTAALYADGDWTGVPDAGVNTANNYVYANTAESGVLGAVAGAGDITSPVADAGPDRTALPNVTLTFDGTASGDDVGITSYEWDFGDGTTATGDVVSHAYADNGTYTVTLTVTDAAGNTDTDTATVTVFTEDATDPVADAGPDQEVLDGTTVSFDGSGSFDDVGIASYEWDFGDGTNATGVAPAHTYATNGTYTVTLTVTDYAGNTATDTATVTVLDEDTTAPVADAGPDRTALAGTPVSFDGSASTDNIGVESYEWDFGDGGTATGVAPTHTYATNGTFTVTLTVADAAGNTDTDTATVTVRTEVEEEPLSPGDISTCGVIEEPGVYTLTADIDASLTNATTCFEVKSGGVTIEGNGHTITGFAGAAEGIHVLGAGEALSNITIRDLTLTGWDTAISTQNVRDSTFVDLRLVSNADAGLVFASSTDGGSADNLVANLTARDNEKGVFVRRGVTGLTVHDSVFDQNHEVGVKISGSSGNQILDSEFTFNDGEKVIHVTGESPNNEIRGNLVANSTETENVVHVGGESPGTVVADNVVRDNALGGISVDPPGATVRNNVVYGNGDAGITLGAGSAVVEGNLVYDNRIGLFLDGATNVDADGNAVLNNTEWDVQAVAGATNNILTGLTVDDNGTTVAVGAGSVGYAIDGGVVAPVPMPGDYVAVADPLEANVSGTLELTVSHGGLGSSEEDDLKLLRFDAVNAWWVAVESTLGRDTISATLTGSAVLVPAYGTTDVQPPQASVTADPTYAGPNQTVTFDASASTDDVAIANYTWDFGDGSNLTTTTAPTANHSYAANGTYEVTVTVTDTSGYTDTASVTVGVDGNPPVAEAGDDVVVQPGVPVSFDGSASTDDVGIAAYDWDFGDGATATGVTATHAYDTVGTYTATLTVTDHVGNVANDTLTVTVDGEQPVPDAGERNRNGRVGESLTFDASASTDDVGIASYDWDFGDGTTASGVSVDHAYDAAGTYTVTLTATDLAGNAASTTVAVEVVDYETVPEAIDADDDGRIGDMEILSAIDYWRTDAEVPGTGGTTIDDFQILELIDDWRSDAGV